MEDIHSCSLIRPNKSVMSSKLLLNQLNSIISNQVSKSTNLKRVYIEQQMKEENITIHSQEVWKEGYTCHSSFSLCLFLVELSGPESIPKHLRKACFASPKRWQGWYECSNIMLFSSSTAVGPSPTFGFFALFAISLVLAPVSLIISFSVTYKYHD